MVKKIKTCVFISGNGSNLNSIIKSSREYNFPIKVELIISSQKNKYVTKCYSSVFEKTVAHAIDNIKIQIRKKR